MAKPIRILLIEDDPGDADLAQDAFRQMSGGGEVSVTCDVAQDGAEALAYLRSKTPLSGNSSPNLILLDLNMPKKSGIEVLREIKADERLKHIPVVVLTTSDDDRDVLEVYRLGASCYIRKPAGLDGFAKLLAAIEAFWLTLVRYPPQ